MTVIKKRMRSPRPILTAAECAPSWGKSELAPNHDLRLSVTRDMKVGVSELQLTITLIWHGVVSRTIWTSGCVPSGGPDFVRDDQGRFSRITRFLQKPRSRNRLRR